MKTTYAQVCLYELNNLLNNLSLKTTTPEKRTLTNSDNRDNC